MNPAPKPAAPEYAELHAISNYSFLRGASHPDELVQEAVRLGYGALAITDECSFAGIVKAHVEARRQGLKLIVGSEFSFSVPDLETPVKLVLLAPDRAAYTGLCALISKARRRCPKGSYRLELRDLAYSLESVLAIWLPLSAEPADRERQPDLGRQLLEFFPGRLWLGVEFFRQPGEEAGYRHCLHLARTLEVPLLACGDVHMHNPARKPLQDVLTGIRLNRPVQTLGRQLQANAERYLRPRDKLAELYPPALLAETTAVAERCHFSLDELRYQYPKELVPEGQTPIRYLRDLTRQGARQRWPEGTAGHVEALLEKELGLIEELGYEYYFLTVYDLVVFARSREILCQGRGSAANSAVCFCLGITEVDPARSQLLFERFISRERDEPPDIDVDFEHERREEVIQYIYKKYSRERAALAATLITYRPRSAIRDVGKALGLDQVLIDQLAKSMTWWDKSEQLAQRFTEAGLGQGAHLAELFARLVQEIQGFPRHLSQHVGGFVITEDPIWSLVPVENAAMAGRTVIQWDKYDIEALGLLKVDVLALGMLTAIRKCLALINGYADPELTLARIPPEDPATYAMLTRADTVGVFQVESRAQMSMLPRLKPKTFYDLVIEIAIIRPGPILGDMVNPYLQRRNGEETVNYVSDELRPILERTLGVPVFQEQVIQIAMVAAGFSGGEADQLRRAMASWGKNGDLGKFENKFVSGMLARGYPRELAERLFRQMQGFGGYGFPESHSASFALLAYVSAWLKCHYPAAFYCALLNSQPMGFYSPAQLVEDARHHGIAVLPVDVDASDWDCTLEPQAGGRGGPAIRLGFNRVKGFNAAAATRLAAARGAGRFRNLQDLKRRAGLDRGQLAGLAAANALPRIGGHRHQAHWQALAVEEPRPLLNSVESGDPGLLSDKVSLPAPSETRDMIIDYASTGLTLGRHPLAMLRARELFARCQKAADLPGLRHGRFVRVAGLVTCRQRPGTAKGTLFITLEDETGTINVIVWQRQQEHFRKALLKSGLLLIKGVMERQDSVIHVIAGHITDASEYLSELSVASRNFH